MREATGQTGRPDARRAVSDPATQKPQRPTQTPDAHTCRCERSARPHPPKHARTAGRVRDARGRATAACDDWRVRATNKCATCEPAMAQPPERSWHPPIPCPCRSPPPPSPTPTPPPAAHPTRLPPTLPAHPQAEPIAQRRAGLSRSPCAEAPHGSQHPRPPPPVIAKPRGFAAPRCMRRCHEAERRGAARGTLSRRLACGGQGGPGSASPRRRPHRLRQTPSHICQPWSGVSRPA